MSILMRRESHVPTLKEVKAGVQKSIDFYQDKLDIIERVVYILKEQHGKVLNGRITKKISIKMTELGKNYSSSATLDVDTFHQRIKVSNYTANGVWDGYTTLDLPRGFDRIDDEMIEKVETETKRFQGWKSEKEEELADVAGMKATIKAIRDVNNALKKYNKACERFDISLHDTLKIS